MRKFFSLLLVVLPLILITMTVHRVDQTHEAIAQKFESVSGKQMFTSDNLSFANQLLLENIQDLQFVLSSYQPLPTLLSLAPDLIQQATELLEYREKISGLSAQEFLSLSTHNPDLYQALSDTSNQLESTLLQAEYLLETNYKQVQKLPELQPIPEVNSIVKFLKHNYTDILSTLKLSRQSLTIANNMLGINKPHNYLILIQNNNELRATGGFIGLLGFLEVDNAQIKSLEFRDVYDFDGTFTGLDTVPLEFQDDNQKLFIRDFNFSPDFPKVSLQIEEYLQQNNAPSFDTIIAINHDVFSQLGQFVNQVSIDNQSYNFSKDLDFVLSYLVESKTHGDNTSKSKVSQMLQMLPEQILANSNPDDLLRFFLNQINTRNIQLFSKNVDLDSALAKLNFRQDLIRLSDTSQMLAFNSVSGTKGDRFIDRHITFVQSFSGDSVTTEVTVNLEHTYTNQTEWVLNSILKSYGLGPMSRDLRFILGRGDYQAFIRAYLPDRSQIIHSDLKLFSATDPFNSRPTLVGGFGITPDQITRFSFTYQTPISFNKTTPTQHTFQTLFQSGLKNTRLTHILNLDNINVHTFSNSNYSFQNNTLVLETDFTSDFKSDFLISK